MNKLIYTSAPHPKSIVANLQSPFSWLSKRYQSCGLAAVQALLGSHPDHPTSEMVFLLSRVKAPGRQSLHNYIKVPEPVVFLCVLPPNKRDSTAIAYVRIYSPGQSQHLRADSTSQDRREPL